MALFTYSDAIDHVLDYLGSGPTADFSRDARRAIQLAYRDLAVAHKWTLYYQDGMIHTVGAYQTGTIQYQDSSGSVPRLVTLTGGVWPSWAQYAVLRFNGNINYEVAARIDDTTLQLAAGSNPGEDVDAGQTYTLYRDTYPLPCDFVWADTMHTPLNWGGFQYVHPRDWLAERVLIATIGTPRYYTFRGDRHYFNTLSLALYPGPDKDYDIQFVYQRRPRTLAIDSYRAGTATTTNNSTTINGSATVWTSNMVNCVIRFSSDNKNYPTGTFGTNPATYERVITQVSSAGSLTVDTAIPANLTGVKYTISDPVDIEDGAMLIAFLRGCEAQAAKSRVLKDRPDAAAAYAMALAEAKAADARTNIMRGVHWERGFRLQLKHMPLGADVP